MLNQDLSHIRVVELGTAIAGPMCGMLLADLGADVIKIEIPGRGDDSRYWGARIKGESPYFIYYNRNKRSLALNLKAHEGKQILYALIQRSDVFIENLRPGVAQRLELSYEELSNLNPKLIYCSVSGFGQSGPYAQLGGYDIIIQALSGIMSVTGEYDGPPLRVGIPITDILAALYAAYSIMVALYLRERTGKGTRIDVSLFESAVAAMGQWICMYSIAGEKVTRFGNRYPLIAPYELFPTKDGYIVVAAGSEGLWQKLCELIQRQDLMENPAFRTNQDRIIPENRERLAAELSNTFKTKNSREWMELLQQAGIPVGVVNTVDQLIHDPHLNARGIFVELDHPSLGTIKIPQYIPRISGFPSRENRAAPLLGQHTREILRELGYSNLQIDELSRMGVIK